AGMEQKLVISGTKTWQAWYNPVAVFSKYCPEEFNEFLEGNPYQKFDFIKVEHDNFFDNSDFFLNNEVKGKTKYLNLGVNENFVRQQLKVDGFPSYIIADKDGYVKDYIMYTRKLVIKYLS
ncbi:hypothetical protein, partial [Rossellomorea yichunensis]|uniref:hypothetical protein n=1 Tax=Rossellomorea yichunensis TaxID=3077331 RepID=UPI0028DFE560